MLINQKNDDVYIPLNALDDNQGYFEVIMIDAGADLDQSEMDLSLPSRFATVSSRKKRF